MSARLDVRRVIYLLELEWRCVIDGLVTFLSQPSML